MKNKIIYVMMAAALLLAFGACSQELDMDRNDSAEGVVRVAFSSKSAITRAVGDEVSTDADKATTNEKAVGTLYAVIFKDVSVESSSSAAILEGAEEDSDTYVKVIELLSDALNSGNSTFKEDAAYKFNLGAGNYQFCFVANPGDGLLSKIKAVATVADFKALVVEEDPATKPMLMTSDYIGGTVTSAGLDLSSKTVTLTRAMARIDVVNKASGVKINSIVLKNRANKSTLETSTGNTSFEDKTYDSTTATSDDTPYKVLPLNGDAVVDANSRYPEYDKVIYSYEQLNTESNLPSIEITYQVGSGSAVTKEIALQTTDGSKITLKRNYLYTVNVVNSKGKVNFTLTVRDWDEGTTFVQDGEALRDGYKNTDTE